MVGRYPVTAVSVEWILEFLYKIIVSPISALLLALLLVGLVISEVVTIIVSLTAFSAWLVVVISVARHVKGMPILRRFAVVVLSACIAAGLTQLYVRWILVSYGNHHREANMGTHVAVSTNPNLDTKLVERMRKLFADELRTVEKRNAKREVNVVPVIPEITQRSNHPPKR
jgi:hypothetical protein